MPLYIVLHNQGLNGTPHHGIVEMAAEDAARHLGDEGTGFLMEADPSNIAFTPEYARVLKAYQDETAAKRLAEELATKNGRADEPEPDAQAIADAKAKKAADEAEANRAQTVAEILGNSTATTPPASGFGSRTSVLTTSGSNVTATLDHEDES